MDFLKANRPGTIGDKVKETLNDNGVEERLKTAEELITNPESWKGNPNTGKRLKKTINPKIGDQLHPNVLNSEIDWSRHRANTAEEAAQNTYSEVLEDDPYSAEQFRKNTHIQFNAEEKVKERLGNLLEQDTDKAVKEALALVNQVEIDLNSAEIREKYDVDLKHGRSLEQQLSDEVFDRLDEQARAFFDYARREERPEGVHATSSINASSADNYDPEEVFQDQIEKLDQQVDSFLSIGGAIVDKEDVYSHINLDEMIKRVNIAQRFNLEDKDIYQKELESAIDEATEILRRAGRGYEDWIQDGNDLLEDSEGLPGVGDKGLKQTLESEISEARSYQSYIDQQIENLEKVRDAVGEQRTSEEAEGFIKTYLR